MSSLTIARRPSPTEIHLPPWLTTGVVDDRLAKIDLDIASTSDEEAKRHLRSCRNALLWICSLPSEIMEHIFLQYADLYDLHGRIGIVSHRNTIAHVCQFWREVALSTPYLWSSIVLKGKRDIPRTRAWLDRARGSLTHFRVSDDVSPERHPTAFRLIEDVLRQPSRLRYLELPISSLKDGSLTFSETLVASTPAPFLRTLHLLYHGRSPDTSLPGEPFGGNTPNLRELVLRNCAIPWSASIFPKLTSLKLEYLSAAALPTGPEFLNLLRNASALQELVLDESIPSTSTPSSTWESSSGINLPALRHLSFGKASFQEYAFLLKNLHFPPTTHLQFANITLERGPQGMSLLPPRVLDEQHYRSQDATLELSWEIRLFCICLHTQKLSVPFLNHWLSPCRLNNDGPCRSRIQASYNLKYLPQHQGSSYEPRLISLLCEGMSFGACNITTLHLHTPGEPYGYEERSIPWGELFAHLPRVKRLLVEFHTGFLREILNELYPSRWGPTAPLPLLENLEPYPREESERYPWDDLVSVLRCRAEDKIPIKTLVMMAEAMETMGYRRAKVELERVVEVEFQ